MGNRLNGSGLFLQAISGLTNTYGYLAQGDGLTLENITNPGENVNKNLLNTQFTSFLTANFNKLDKNGDGIVTQEELQNYTNSLSKNGMTIDELYQLCAQYGGTNSTLETVIANFNKVDTNHDGKVSNEEIAVYGVSVEIDEMKEKFPKFNASAMSIFYDTGDSEEA